MTDKEVRSTETGIDEVKFTLHHYINEHGVDNVYAFDLRVTNLDPRYVDMAIEALKMVRDMVQIEDM